jgi:hypothetical protein
VTAALVDVDLDELFSLDVPCDGVPDIRPPCGAVADVTIVFCHGCTPTAPNRCQKCYIDGLRRVQGIIQRHGMVRCRMCKSEFADIEDYVRFRPL